MSITPKIKEDDREVKTFHALIVARDAFQAYLAQDGGDPCYWDFKFTAWTLDLHNFARITRVEIEDEIKDIENLGKRE